MTKFVNFANQKLQERNASLDLSRATKILQNDLDRQILSRDNDLKENHDVYKAPGDENSYQQLNPIQQLNPLLMNPNAENVHLGSAHQSAVSLSNLNRGRGVNRQAMMSALFGVNPEDKNYLLPAKEFTDQELWQGYLDYHVELQKQFLLQQEQVIRDVTDLATLFDEGANLTEKFSLKDTDFCTRGENSMMIIDDKKVEAELEKRAGNYYPEGIDLPNILREGDVQIKDFNAFKTAEIIKGILCNPEPSQSEKNVALSYLWIRAVKEVNDSKTAFALSRDKEGDFVQMLNGNKTDEEIKSFFEEKKQESLEALKQIASPDDVLSQGKLALIKDKLEFDKFSSKPDLLLLAARNKYLEALDILLGGNIDVNHTNQDGTTALMFAAYCGHSGVAKELLKHPKIDVNKAHKSSNTALMIAAYYGHSGVVEQLLAAPGIEVNKADENGATALMIAAEIGHSGVAKELLKHPKIDVNKVHESGTTALMAAAQNGQLEVVKELLEHQKIDVNQTKKNGATALMAAAESGQLEVVKELLKHPKIDVNKASEKGFTALMFAAKNGQLEVVKELLEDPRTDVNQAKKNGATALMLAAESGQLEVAKELLKHPRIDVNKVHESGVNALIIAAKNGHSGVAKELLEHQEIDVNQKTKKNGATALMIAAESGQLEVVKKLLKHPGIVVNEVHKSGLNALMFAAQNGQLEVVKELLKHSGIVVDQKTKKGDATALMLAAHNGHQEVVDTIVKKLCIDGVDPQEISYLPEGRPKIFNDANKISHFANLICGFIATDLNLSAACHHDKLKPLVRKSLFKEIFADENKENVNHITNRFAQKEVAKQVAEEVAEAIEEKLQSSRKVKPSKSVLSLVLSSELKTLDTEDEEVKELVGAPIKELVKKVALEPDTNPMHSQGMAAIGGRANNNRELS